MISLRIDRFFQVGRYALERDALGADNRGRLVRIDAIREGKPEADGSKQHLDAYYEILISSRNCSGPHAHLAIW